MSSARAATPPVRVMVPTVGTALVASTLAVMVNLATEWKTSSWAWVAVAALTLISGGLSLWWNQRQARTDSSLDAEGMPADGSVHIHTESGGVAVARIENMHQHYYGARAAASEELPPPQPGRHLSVPTRVRRRLLMVAMVVGALLVAGSTAVGFWLTGSAGERASTTDLAPAVGLVHSRCMQVTGKDVRVFTDPHGEQTWTRWTTGTRFWVDSDTSPLPRYRTTLRNGNHGWIGTNPQWVASASDCT